MDFLAHGYADHIVSRADLTRGYDGSNDAVIMRGGGDFRHFYPVRNRSGPLAFNALREMCGPEDPRRYYTDASPELKWAIDAMGWRGHATSAPGEWKSNGVIECDVGLLKGGIRSSNAQAGFPGIAWPLTGRHWTMVTNIQKVENPKHYLYGTSP